MLPREIIADVFAIALGVIGLEQLSTAMRREASLPSSGRRKRSIALGKRFNPEMEIDRRFTSLERKESLITMAKGLVVGGTMLVPGVSGGTMCILLGIYDQLIHAVSTFFQRKRDNFLLLFWFCLGSGLGMFLLSKPLFQLMEYFPRPAGFFFMGAVAGSIPLTFQKARVTKFTWHIPVFVFIGIMIVWGIEKLPTMDQIEGGGLEQGFMLLVAGAVAAVALILPGISVSYLLLVLGLYAPTIQAIGRLDVLFLLPLGVGLLLGIVATTKLLEHLMQKYPLATYLIILGFVTASIPTIFPGVPGGLELVACGLTLLAGFGMVYKVSHL